MAMNEKKFDGMGKIYSQFRPSYPQEFIEYLFSNVGISINSIIADIGSGTGILTQQLLEKCNRIYAIEPNDDMRRVAEIDLRGYANYISVNGTAENTTLQNESIDFITVAQAFHWFDRKTFKKECQRILKPNGIIILVWNSRDEKSKLVIENDEINRKYCPNFKGFSGGMRGATSDDDFSDFFCGSYEVKLFDNPLKFDKQGFIGRNLSASYALKETDEDYEAYVAQLVVLFEKHSKDGFLTMPNLTRSYVGTVFRG
jgi:SAM-dependent methyltransferase